MPYSEFTSKEFCWQNRGVVFVTAFKVFRRDDNGILHNIFYNTHADIQPGIICSGRASRIVSLSVIYVKEGIHVFLTHSEAKRQAKALAQTYKGKHAYVVVKVKCYLRDFVGTDIKYAHAVFINVYLSKENYKNPIEVLTYIPQVVAEKKELESLFPYIKKIVRKKNNFKYDLSNKYHDSVYK